MGRTDGPPKWIKPQLTRLVEEAPSGAGWVHEIKYDGYRMHARIDGRDIRLLTRTGLDVDDAILTQFIQTRSGTFDFGGDDGKWFVPC